VIAAYASAMVLAELEVFHSRPIAPTRRVALGASHLPCDPPPGYGGVLLGGIAARFAPHIDPDLLPDVVALTHELDAGRRIPQPRLRHRLQDDRIGLSRSVHTLVATDDGPMLRFDDDTGAPAQFVLAAVYAAGRLPRPGRGVVMETVRRGLRWGGDIGPALVAHLAGRGASALSLEAVADPIGWALAVLGLSGPDRPPARSAIQRRYREALRDAHPDHGGAEDDAARRIAEITAARRILLAS
jgi:hypothetical protein